MEIESAVSMAGYAGFALQQPLNLDHLAAAAERADLPMAAGAAADGEFAAGSDLPHSDAVIASPQRAQRLLAGAPEIAAYVDQAEDTRIFRRASDPEPFD